MKALCIGTKTKWGVIIAIGWVGERYYWMIDKEKSIAMMPASTVEENANN